MMSDQASCGGNTAGSYTAHEFRNRWPFSPALSKITTHSVSPQNVRLPCVGERWGGRLGGCSPHHGLTTSLFLSPPLLLTRPVSQCCTGQALDLGKAVGHAPTS